MKFKSIILPYIIWISAFTTVPIFLLIYFAFTNFHGEFTIQNLLRACEFSNVLTRSLIYAAITSIISLLLGYPAAFFLKNIKIKNNFFWVIIFTLPMSLNFLLKTYAWMTFLEDGGILNSILKIIGLGKVHIINTPAAVITGMINDFLPYMILPIYNFLSKFDESLIESARDLGANSLQIFKKIIFPLSVPSVITGIIMVFVPSVSTFLISKMLGGVNDVLIGDLIEMQFLGNSYNPHLGSAISLILMVVAILCIGILNKMKNQPVP